MNRQRQNYFRFAVTYYLMVLIPITIILIGGFVIQGRQAGQQLMDTIISGCDREMEYLDQQVIVMNSYVRECRYNKNYLPEYAEKEPIPSLAICDDLKEKEANFPFAEGICLVRPAQKQVITSSCIYSDANYPAGFTQMEEQFSKHSQRDFNAYRTEDENGEGKIVMWSPIHRWEESIQYLVFVIPEKRIAKHVSIDSIDGCNMTGLYFGDETLYEKNTLRRENEQCLVFEKTLDNGFRIVHKVPSFLTVKTVFSFLKEFAVYAVGILLIGIALAYFFSRRKYDVFHKMLVSKDSLEGERDSLRKENCLYEILSHGMSKGDARWNRCLENHIHLDRTYYFFVVLPTDYSKSKIRSWLDKQSDENGTAVSYRIPMYEEVDVYLVCSNESKKSLEKRISGFRECADLGVSSLVTDISQLRKAYREARKNFCNACRNIKIYPEMEMQALRNAIEMGEQQKSNILLDNLLDMLPESDHQVVVRLVVELSQIAGVSLNTIYDSTTNSITIDISDFAQTVKRAFAQKDDWNKEELCEEPEQIENARQKRNITDRNIADVLHYIQDNYLEADFSIKHMANEFDMTSSNLSHFFKKHMGISLGQYIEQIKIDKAKELLETDDMTIGEISLVIGYGRSTAFIESFKRHEGITPGAYKKQIAAEKNQTPKN